MPNPLALNCSASFLPLFPSCSQLPSARPICLHHCTASVYVLGLLSILSLYPTSVLRWFLIVQSGYLNPVSPRFIGTSGPSCRVCGIEPPRFRAFCSSKANLLFSPRRCSRKMNVIAIPSPKQKRVIVKEFRYAGPHTDGQTYEPATLPR